MFKETKMGCDIHGYIEELVNNEWTNSGELIKNHEMDYGDEPPSYDLNSEISIGRNYDLFGLLACVRSRYLGDLCHPDKGFPEDASDQVAEMFKQWDCDAHTPSYHTLGDLKEMRKEVTMKNLLKPFNNGVDWVISSLDDVINAFDPLKYDESQRLVFWFDN